MHFRLLFIPVMNNIGSSILQIKWHLTCHSEHPAVGFQMDSLHLLSGEGVWKHLYNTSTWTIYVSRREEAFPPWITSGPYQISSVLNWNTNCWAEVQPVLSWSITSIELRYNQCWFEVQPALSLSTICVELEYNPDLPNYKSLRTSIFKFFWFVIIRIADAIGSCWASWCDLFALLGSFALPTLLNV